MKKLCRASAVCACVIVAITCAQCTNDDSGAAGAAAKLGELRSNVASLTFDTAKAEYFFPGELDAARSAWTAADASANDLAVLTAAHDAYQSLNQRLANIAWISTFGGEGYEEAADVTPLTGGGYLVAADTTSFGQGQRDAFVLEIDSAGNEIHRFAFGGAENDSAMAASKRPDGGMVVAGRTSSYDDWTGDAYLVSADSAGNEQWHKTFGATGTDSFECMFPNGDGIIAIGSTFDGGGGKNILFVHLDAAGQELRNTILPGELDDWVNTGLVMPDGNIALAGGRGTLNASDIEFLLLIVKPDGIIVSEHTFDYAGVSTTGATGIARAADGSFYLLGQTMESMEKSEDIILLHVAADGALLWNKTVEADAEEVAGGVVATEDGAVFAATTETYGAGGRDILLAKYGADGNELWAHTLGSKDDESARAIALAPDGGFLIVGERGTFIEGIQDVYAVKTDAKGFSWMGQPFGAGDLKESHEHQAQPEPGAMPEPTNEEALEVGDDAPPVVAGAWFNVPEALKETLKPNTELRAKDLGAKLLVVEFWATWCVPCKITIPHINEMHRAHAGDGVLFLSLTDEDAALAPVETFMRENAMETIVGSGSPSGFPFGAWTIPYAFVIDPNGKVLWTGHPMDGLDEAIKAGLEGAK